MKGVNIANELHPLFKKRCGHTFEILCRAEASSVNGSLQLAQEVLLVHLVRVQL